MKKTLITDFKKNLLEASKLFNRPPHQVTFVQWSFVVKGRVPQSLVRVFGFAALRNAVAPSPDTTSAERTAAKKIIERLVINA